MNRIRSILGALVLVTVAGLPALAQPIRTAGGAAASLADGGWQFAAGNPSLDLADQPPAIPVGLLGLHGEVMCAATPEEMDAAIWATLKAFALEDTQHQHVPPAKGVHYPPLKGPGTMPAPDTDS